MSEPVFFLQIVDRGGQVAKVPGGGALEAEIIDICTRYVLSKGVGFFRSEAHVEKDIRDGIREAFLSLKTQTKYIV